MKHFLTSLIFILFLSSCQNKCEERYTQQSAEIDTYKNGTQAYLDQDWDAWRSNFSEDAQFYYNATDDNPSNIDQTLEVHKNTFETFESISFLTDHDFHEMAVTDDGETWVNYWGVWQATLKATGQVFQMPLHITSQYVDGKAVKTYGYWNSSEITVALMALENAAEETIE